MTGDIRLLVLNCEYPPLGGGAATATRQLLDNLSGLGVRATLITASADSRSYSEDTSGAGRIDYVAVGKKDIHYWTSGELLRYAWKALKHARTLLAEGEVFDVCHAFFTLPAGAAAWRLRRRFPYIVSLRGSDVPGYSGRFKWLYSAAAPLFGTVWKNASAVVANSEELRLLALESAPNLEIGVIPNGVDTDVFHPGPPRDRAGRLLCVARLVARKDVETVVRAMALLARTQQDITLTVVGDGPQAPQLEELAKSAGVAGSVDFRRYVPREAMPDVYREADIFVTTSRREGMSNTVLEALASGLPIIASREAMAGVEGASALEVPSGDPEAVARAAAHLIEDDDARRMAGALSRETALRYTWRAMAEKYAEIYRRVAAGCGRIES